MSSREKYHTRNTVDRVHHHVQAACGNEFVSSENSRNRPRAAPRVCVCVTWHIRIADLAGAGRTAGYRIGSMHSYRV